MHAPRRSILLFLGRLACGMLLSLVLASASAAQSTDFPQFALFGGAGITNASNAVHGSFHFGADFDQGHAWSPSRPLFPVGYLFEGGYIAPVNSFAAGSAILSLNYLGKFNFSDKSDAKATLFFTGGYTRMFGTGNAINFGGGVDCRISDRTGLRFEVRDYRRAGGPTEHNMAIRIALLKTLAD